MPLPLGRTSTPSPAVSSSLLLLSVAVTPDSAISVVDPSFSTVTEPVTLPSDATVSVAPVTVTRTYGPAGRPAAAVGRVLTSTVADVALKESGVPLPLTVALNDPARPVTSLTSVAVPLDRVSV